MYKKADFYLLHCITPLHAGSGEAHSFIDLPIQREKHTRIPKIEGSSLKGAIREAVEDGIKLSADVIDRLFGKDVNPDASASLGFSDARLLLFPIRSSYGVFAWITCPMVLNKFFKEYNLVSGDKIEFMFPNINDSDNNKAFSEVTTVEKILLEEYLFEVKPINGVNIAGESVSKWLGKKLFHEKTNGEIEFFKNRLFVINDTVFQEFTERYTIVVTRNKIDNKTGVVMEGALFNEEYLPDESVLYHFVTASDEFRKEQQDKENKDRINAEENLKAYNDMDIKIIQLGGDMTIGKGIITITKI